MKENVIDARGGEHIFATGTAIRKLIREKISASENALAALITRMNNEIPDKESAVTLMVALGGGGVMNERALFFKACVERGAFLENEIRDLNTLGPSFKDDGTIYQLTVKDAQRYGL